MRIIKFFITLSFLATSYWLSYLIFSRNFAHMNMEFSADNWDENTFMIVITSTGLSMVGVLCMGLLSMFANFVFIRLVYVNEIKQAAYFLVQKNRKVNRDLIEYRKSVEAAELSKMTWYQRMKFRLSGKSKLA